MKKKKKGKEIEFKILYPTRLYKQEMKPGLRELASFQSRLWAFYQPHYGQDSRVWDGLAHKQVKKKKRQEVNWPTLA